MNEGGLLSARPGRVQRGEIAAHGTHAITSSAFQRDCRVPDQERSTSRRSKRRSHEASIPRMFKPDLFLGVGLSRGMRASRDGGAGMAVPSMPRLAALANATEREIVPKRVASRGAATKTAPGSSRISTLSCPQLNACRLRRSRGRPWDLMKSKTFAPLIPLHQRSDRRRRLC